MSPLGANVKLGESGFVKSVIQRQMSEIWPPVLADMGEPPARRRSPVPAERHPKDIANCTRETVLRGPQLYTVNSDIYARILFMRIMRGTEDSHIFYSHKLALARCARRAWSMSVRSELFHDGHYIEYMRKLRVHSQSSTRVH